MIIFIDCPRFTCNIWTITQDADLALAPPGDPLTVLGKFSIVAMGDKVAVQTKNVRAIGASTYIPNGTYPKGSVIPVVVIFSVEVCKQWVRGSVT